MHDPRCRTRFRWLRGAAAAFSVVPAALARPDAPDVSGDILYQIMPIAWRDSDNDANRFGDFGGLTASLDYLQSLGVTAVYLNPIFPSPAYHGYQHGPADRLNPRFGTEPQFLTLVSAAHARGMKVYLDFVAYGISTDSVWFRSAYKSPASPYSRWFAFTNPDQSKYTGYSFTTWNGDRVGFAHWNLDNDGPVGLVTTWAGHWLDPNGDGDPRDGIDGYRLDHVFAAAPEGWGATIGFWERWATAARRSNPNVFLFCEPGDWTSSGRDVLTPAGFDGAIAKPLEFAARDALNSGLAGPLYKAMDAALAALPPGKTLVAEINDHDSDRVASVVGGDMARCKLVAAILLTLPFPPNIYSGDEIGMLGTKADYGGDANDTPMREPFKWNAVAGPPMSNYFRLNAAAYGHRYERDHDGRSVEEQSGVAGSLLEEYRRLIAIRKGSAALKKGRYIPVPSPDPHVWAFVRHDAPSGETVLVAMNLSGEPVATTLNPREVAAAGRSTPPRDVVTGESLAPIERGGYAISLPAYGYRLLAATERRFDRP